MNITLTLIASLAAALVGSIVKKYYTNMNPKGLSSGFIFNAVGSLIAAVILIFWSGFDSVSSFTLILGIVFGVITASQGIMNIAAFQCGPMSYTSVIISFSTLISALSGSLFFNEKIAFVQIIGIALMLLSFVLAPESNTQNKKASLKWLILCIGAFFATGGIGIMQKVHQSSAFKDELNEFLILAFIASAAVSVVPAILLKNKETADSNTKEAKNPRKFILMLVFIAVSGICVALNNKFNLYLSGVMESAVFFPVFNGGNLVLTTLAAVIIFRERLSKKQWIGMLLGIVSVILLCNPFA